jgi:hypothetical protein
VFLRLECHLVGHFVKFIEERVFRVYSEVELSVGLEK